MNNNFDDASDILKNYESPDTKKAKVEKKREYTAYKFSNRGESDLYEAIIMSGIPYFLKFNKEKNKTQFVPFIEDATRIIRPPEKEQYPYQAYEFENFIEIEKYVNKIMNEEITLDSLFKNSKALVNKFNDQDPHVLDLIAADIIFSYFQDRFTTTHYLLILGGNGSGKSSLGDTFGAIGYRVVIMTDPTASNLFRLLGFIEPGQCTIILEEAERIDQSQDLMGVLKTGYSYYGKVPRINTNTNKQEFFYSFCFKIIISERAPNQLVAKGVHDRIYSTECYQGDPQYDIKEVLNPTNTGNGKNKEMLKEIIEFRKKLLIYRLMHFKDPIPDLDIGIKGREKELAKPLIQLFQNSEVLDIEILPTLQKFVDIRTQRKESSLDSTLLLILNSLIPNYGNKIKFSTFWDNLKGFIKGKEDERKPNEYHSEEYGTLYRTTITSILNNMFGIKSKHERDGNVLIINIKIINKISKKYNTIIKLNNGTIKTNNNQENFNNNDNIENKENNVKAVNSVKSSEDISTNEHESEKTNTAIEPTNLNQLEQSYNTYSALDNGKVIGESKNRQTTLPILTSQSSQSSHIQNNALMLIEKEKEPEFKRLILYNFKNIQRQHPRSDNWICPNCSNRGDIFFMLKHRCKGFSKEQN